MAGGLVVGDVFGSASRHFAEPCVPILIVAYRNHTEGNIYLKLRKNPEAIDAFTKAAAMSPNPAVAYFNLCATSFNAGDTAAALPACDKAIAADPTKADAYFVKGSVMLGSGTVDAKGKFVVPKGTVETLKKYLELQPNGAHASDVKEMLNAIK
jgi:tetratricopeptide (TPR) repeat protein